MIYSKLDIIQASFSTNPANLRMTQDRLAWGTVHGTFFIIRLCSVNYAGCPANVLQRLQGETKTIIPELGVTAVSRYTLLLLLLLGRFSRVRLCDPIDGSPPGSPVPGILQARALERGAIAFSAELMQI